MLQSFVESLPPVEYPLDPEEFSGRIRLYAYQRKALENVHRLILYYYREIGEDRSKLWEEYRRMGFDEEWTVSSSILREHFREDELTYRTFVNRASFWMATGSGKTVVVVKLIELLDHLMGEGVIPRRDILFLTHRDDLILSFKRHVEEYNQGRDRRILLEELRSFNRRKANPQPADRDNVLVFYYRSDLVSDRRGDRTLDYRYYHGNGEWYLILDEAHKGDSEESKRRQIYMVLTRNGFMFNFSATFTDAFDRASTVYRFNLADFVRQGYGKHIVVMDTQTEAFREKDAVYTGEEKRNTVTKLLLLTGFLRKIRDRRYPPPLAVVLVNTVNTEDADLKLFFNELFSVAGGSLDQNGFAELREELTAELGDVEFWAERGKLREDEIEELRRFTLEDLYRYFFSSTGPSQVEVVYHPENRQELVLKLRGGSRPFALVKIGDIVSWLRSVYGNLVVSETLERKEYFLNIDEMDNVSLLAGSRSFYEGWDSPRPAAIMFVNIGSRDARKFILQSVGRGVRVKIKEGDREYRRRRDLVRSLETLHIFATDRRAVLSVVNETLKNESAEEWEKLEVVERNPLAEGKDLLVPVYVYSDRGWNGQFRLHAGEEEIREAEALVKNAESDAVLCLLTGRDPETVREVKRTLSGSEGVVRVSGRLFRDPLSLLKRLGDLVSAASPEVSCFADARDRIEHYRHIEVDVRRLTSRADLENAIRDSLSSTRARRLLESEYGISAEWFEKHLYLPLLKVADGASAGAVSWIRGIVKHESEVKFVRDLTENSLYLDEISDWWMFSRIDGAADRDVYIPYHRDGKEYRWHPDFLLWLERERDYFVVFLDAKGAPCAGYQARMDSARRLFGTGNGTPRVFELSGRRVRVLTLIYRRTPADTPEPYRSYWVESVRDIRDRIVSACSG